jgi:hypothetical protein
LATFGTPKLTFTDTGIACHLIGQDASRLGEPDGAAGQMIENFVMMELSRQLTWSAQRARLYHYRTRTTSKQTPFSKPPTTGSSLSR